MPYKLLTTVETEAWECTGYGAPSVLRLIQKSLSAPKENEILVRVHAVTVSSGDCRVRSLRLPRGFGLLGRPVLGFFKPRCGVLGSDFAGEVIAKGKAVQEFHVGDRVTGFTGTKLGCHARHLVISIDKPLVKIPGDMSYEDVVSHTFGSIVAMHFIRKAGIKRGETVLVIGASGAVGIAFVQMCKHFGAAVTGVSRAENHDMLKELGADDVFDYRTSYLKSLATKFDVIVDAVGASTYSRLHVHLAEKGRFIAVAAELGDLVKRPHGGHKIIGGQIPLSKADFETIIAMASRKILRPIIGARFVFSEIRQAHELVDTGHKRGSVVVSVD